MAVCDLCGESAGWFQSRHPACNTRAEDARKRLYELTLDGISTGKGYTELETEARQLAAEKRVPLDHFRETLLQGANDAASKIALQSPVSEDEYRRVFDILQGWGIQEYLKTPADYAQRRWFGLPRLDMSLILWQVLHGLVPVYDGAGRMQFNLQSGEQAIFSAGKVAFAEERTISTHARTFGGLSVPIGAGIYYHVGGSQGHQEQVSGLVPLDVGEVLITTHALLFGGQRTTLRIPLNRVIRYQSYVDGVGVCEAHGAPKVFVPDYSGMDAGWFFFNLLSALTSNLTQQRTPSREVSRSPATPSPPKMAGPPGTKSTSTEFVALDVETANAACSSICQIGIARFKDGRLAEEWSALLNPEDYFDPFNISIHSITEEMVEGSPVFPKLVEEIRRRLEGRIVLCHTPFDRVAIAQACVKYGLERVECQWLDSARVARRTWTQFARTGCGLRNVCAAIGYDFRHHDALEDAKAAAQVLLAAMKETGLDLAGWLKRVQQPVSGSITQAGDPEGPLHGEVLVFTGALEITRSEAAQLAATVGCTVVEGVTKETTMLVVGNQDARRLAGHQKSSKHRKAEDLILKGQAIKILTEGDFENLVRLATLA